EKIDFDFFKTSIKADMINDDGILNALNFWKNQEILDYEYEASAGQNSKGVNMDNIISILSNIKKDINIMNTPGEDDDSDDSYEFDEIYRFNRTNKNIKINKTGKCENCEKLKNAKKTDKSDKIDDSDNLNKFETASIYKNAKEETETFEISILTDDYDNSENYEFEIEDSIKDINNTEPETSEKSAKPEKKSNTAVRPQPVASGSVSIDKLSDALETSEDFQRLYQTAQIKMRSMFNTAEIEILYNLYEINKIEVDLILKLAEICVEEGKNNIRYLEKFALGLAANGILNFRDYEASFEESRKVQQFEDKIRTLFNIGDQKLTAKERNHIKTWVLEFDFPDDVLLEGYKKCIESGKFEKASINYINGIYIKWHEKGFKTLDDINNEYGSPNGGFSTDGKKTSSFNLEQFFEKAAKKSMKTMK
ncbi:MAG: DnaD domain protein, partial [Oscillospiraceae bacterium]|nr:DnaD domain protein [Oscillospiraceae bacterium]